MSLNHIRPWRNIYRRKSRQIMVGNVPVGGDAPITVQTMTNTLTTDPAMATLANRFIAAAMRPAPILCACRCRTLRQRSKAMKEICQANPPCRSWPTSTSTTNAALRPRRRGLPALRINPGNIGDEKRDQGSHLSGALKITNCSIRIGVNAGSSLEKQLLDKYGEPCP